MIWGNKDPMQPKWWEESKPSFPSSSSEAGTAAIPLNPAFSVAEVTLIQPCPEILKIKIHFCLYRICWVWYLHLAHAMVFITTERKTDSRKGLTVPGTDFLMTFFFFFFGTHIACEESFQMLLWSSSLAITFPSIPSSFEHQNSYSCWSVARVVSNISHSWSYLIPRIG